MTAEATWAAMEDVRESRRRASPAAWRATAMRRLRSRCAGGRPRPESARHRRRGPSASHPGMLTACRASGPHGRRQRTDAGHQRHPRVVALARTPPSPTYPQARRGWTADRAGSCGGRRSTRSPWRGRSTSTTTLLLGMLLVTVHVRRPAERGACVGDRPQRAVSPRRGPPSSSSTSTDVLLPLLC